MDRFGRLAIVLLKVDFFRGDNVLVLGDNFEVGASFEFMPVGLAGAGRFGDIDLVPPGAFVFLPAWLGAFVGRL